MALFHVERRVPEHEPGSNPCCGRGSRSGSGAPGLPHLALRDPPSPAHGPTPPASTHRRRVASAGGRSPYPPPPADAAHLSCCAPEAPRDRRRLDPAYAVSFAEARRSATRQIGPRQGRRRTRSATPRFDARGSPSFEHRSRAHADARTRRALISTHARERCPHRTRTRHRASTRHPGALSTPAPRAAPTPRSRPVPAPALAPALPSLLPVCRLYRPDARAYLAGTPVWRPLYRLMSVTDSHSPPALACPLRAHRRSPWARSSTRQIGSESCSAARRFT